MPKLAIALAVEEIAIVHMGGARPYPKCPSRLKSATVTGDRRLTQLLRQRAYRLVGLPKAAVALVEQHDHAL